MNVNHEAPDYNFQSEVLLKIREQLNGRPHLELQTLVGIENWIYRYEIRTPVISQQ